MKRIPSILFSTLAGVLLAALSLSAAERKSGAGWQTWFKDGLDGAKVVSGKASYKVENGVLVGTTVEGSANSFLVKGPYKDFELEFEVNVDDALNSGVQVRSHIAKEGDPVLSGSKKGKALPAGRMYGPQCEIAINGTAGDFYDEARRATWWSILTNTGNVRTDAAKAAFKKGEWNHYRIVVKGDHYQSFVNGVPTADFRQPNDPEGFIGFQVHGIKAGTGPYSVRWRNIRFRETKQAPR
ncbi:MAG: 3-keto-disaccharide hydrolase [Opitutaceae bacterium]